MKQLETKGGRSKIIFHENRYSRALDYCQIMKRPLRSAFVRINSQGKISDTHSTMVHDDRIQNRNIHVFHLRTCCWLNKGATELFKDASSDLKRNNTRNLVQFSKKMISIHQQRPRYLLDSDEVEHIDEYFKFLIVHRYTQLNFPGKTTDDFKKDWNE